MQNIKISSAFDGLSLNVNIYTCENPTSIIQVIHGMSEHQNRYEKLAKTLATDGHIVVTSDLRGHGKSVEKEDDLGYFYTNNGIEALVADQKSISNYILKKYPNLPLYIFSHSMGTMIARSYIMTNDLLIERLILCGAPNYNKMSSLGIIIGNIICKTKGDKYYSKFLEDSSTGTFNKKIKNPESKNTWISYSKENVKNYDNDKYCGFPFKSSAYLTLIKLNRNIKNYKQYHTDNEDLKILFIAGKDDPCTGGEKGINSSIYYLKKAGYHDISKKIFENMRHEILNEENNENVQNTIKEFFRD